jgi:rubredoxin
MGALAKTGAILKTSSEMKKYKCPCRYIYDPYVGCMQNKIPPGTPFEDVPDDWLCPFCGYEKEFFTVVNDCD